MIDFHVGYNDDMRVHVYRNLLTELIFILRGNAMQREKSLSFTVVLFSLLSEGNKRFVRFSAINWKNTVFGFK